MKILNLLLFFNLFFAIISCSEPKIIYSGKIINQKNLENLNVTNKIELIENFGQPSFIDPIENKFFYFSEVSKKKSILKKEIKYSYVFVFKINEYDKIVETKVFDTREIKNINFSDDKTSNEIVKRGLLEKIFGGVGTQQELPTTP